MAEPIKVVMLTDKFENRGTSAYTLRLTEKFPPEDVESKIFCGDASQLADDRKKKLDVREYRHQGVPVWGRIVQEFMIRRMAQFKPDLIHIQTPRLLRRGMRLARRLKCPYIVTVHNVHAKRRRFPFDLNRGKKIICVSDAVKKDLISKFSYDRNLITVIHSGVEIIEIDQTLSVLDGNHVPVVGTAGPLEEVKGITFFLEAAKIILNKGSDVEFLVAGTGPEEIKLRRLAQKLGINSHVTFVPNMYDFSTSLMAMDVFCLPSLSQGLGTIMLQAMARGKPVIASGVGGIFSVIEDQETGLVIPPSDPQALAGAIESVLNDPMKARTIGKTARRLVETGFSVQKMLDETLQVYREVLNRKPENIETK